MFKRHPRTSRGLLSPASNPCCPRSPYLPTLLCPPCATATVTVSQLFGKNSISSHFVALEVSTRRTRVTSPCVIYPTLSNLLCVCNDLFPEPLQQEFIDHEGRDHSVLFTSYRLCLESLIYAVNMYGVLRSCKTLC